MAFNRTALFLITVSLSLTTPGHCQSSVLPSFTTQPTSGAVVDGDSHSLTCNLSSSPLYNDITITWLLNETPITEQAHDDNGNTLSITSFGVSNNGNYTCLASTSEWSLRSSTVLVQVAYVDSPFDGAIKSITKKKKEAFTIDCIPGYSAYPMDKLDWEWHLVSGSSLTTPNSNNLEYVSRDKLNIRRLASERTYQCKITSQVDSSQQVTHRTTIQVEGEAASENSSIITKPEDIVANAGEDVNFYCVPGGTGGPTVTWTSDVKSNLDTLEVLPLTEITESNQGMYNCTVDTTSESASATLIVRDPPVFTTTIPSTLSITYGESHTLSCTASGDDVQLMWYHNGVLVSTSGEFTISDAGLSDEGAYQCFAVSPAMTISNSILITIATIPPSFLSNGTLYDQVVFTGSRLTLSCEATGAPPPFIKWKKDGADPILLNVNTSIPGSLIIPAISDLYEGQYTCIAEGKLGGLTTGKENSSATITVTDPTVFTSTNPSSISSYIGNPFYLNCSVSHDTVKINVQLSWTLNGETITDTNKLASIGQNDLQLTISNASKSDEGDYQCIATSTYTGDASLPVPVVMSTFTNVVITDVPVEPSVTLVRAVGPRILEVSWTYKGFIENLREYRLETMKIGENEWVHQAVVPKSSTTLHNITNLTPYTQYSVRVIVILDSNGDSVPSNGYEPTRTGEDLPYSAPPASRIDVILNNSTITLEWQAPDEYVNGILTDYTIRYWSNTTRNASFPEEASVGSNQTRYTLTNLQPDTVYWTRIAAHTSVGRGPFSDPPVQLSTIPRGEGVEDAASPFYSKIWFVLIVALAGLLLIVVLTIIIATVRWRSKNKGNIYTVRHSRPFPSDEVSLSEDVVADYNRRRDKLTGFTESVDGSRQNVHDTQIDYPSFGRTDSFMGSRGSIRGSFRGSFRAGLPGAPPEYINPPSFEETLKARLAKRRSASTTLLEKIDHTNFRGSGWSVGHDPKSGGGFFIPQSEGDVDSMIVKPSFSEPGGEETSAESDTSTGFHSQSVTNVESFAQFV